MPSRLTNYPQPRNMPKYKNLNEDRLAEAYNAVLENINAKITKIASDSA